MSSQERRRRDEEDVRAEIEAHMALEEDALRAEGHSGEEARYGARRSFGNPLAAQELVYEAARPMRWENMVRDVLQAARRLRRSPGFSCAVVTTLALAIAANAAVFGIFDAALFSPLKLPRADELVAVYGRQAKTGNYLSVSYPDYADLARETRQLRSLAAYVRLPLHVESNGVVERLPFEVVTPNYFETLELGPRLADDTVLLSESYVREHPAATTLRVEGHALVVGGTAPAHYRGVNLNWGEPPRAWVTFATLQRLMPRLAEADILHQRGARWLLVLGRLREGATPEQASAELASVAARQAREHPATNRDITVAVETAARSKFWPAYRAAVARWMAVLNAASALMLLLACATVTNLLLERALARRRETAIRLAIGASRWRTLRPWLMENLLLALPSWALALPLAWGLQTLLGRFPNAFGLPLALAPSLDGRLLLMSVALTFVATLAVTIAPAWQAAGTNLVDDLKESGNSSAGARTEWLRRVLVMAQVALSALLLVGVGLFGRALMRGRTVDLGFDTRSLVMLSLDAAPGREAGSDGQLGEALERLPGVEAAAVSTNTPLSTVHMPARVTGGANAATVRWNAVTANYFRTMRIALLAGREFRRDEREPVVIVNQSLARRLWPETNPLNRVLTVDAGTPREQTLRVVGVARDVRVSSIWETDEPYFYRPFSAGGHANCIVVRTSLAPATLAREVRRTWPQLALIETISGRELRDGALGPQRLASALLGAFAVLAAVLASLGLASLMGYSVRRRRREFGIRLALGATPASLFNGVLCGAAVMAMAGSGIGLSAAALLAPLAASRLGDVSAHDGAVFVSAALLLLTVSLASACGPAWRASRLAPHTALRQD